MTPDQLFTQSLDLFVQMVGVGLVLAVIVCVFIWMKGGR